MLNKDQVEKLTKQILNPIDDEDLVHFSWTDGFWRCISGMEEIIVNLIVR